MQVTIPVKSLSLLIMTSRSVISKAVVLLYLFLGISIGLPQITNAQFIDLRLNIDSEITARTEQPLNFGTLNTNSGRHMIELGSINMGVFSITGLENQMLLLNLDKPIELRHDNTAITSTIPLQLYSRYGNSSQNYQDSYPLPEATSSIKVEPNPDPGPWNTIYIFMYGSVDVADVPDGIYSNQIILSVEYM